MTIQERHKAILDAEKKLIKGDLSVEVFLDESLAICRSQKDELGQIFSLRVLSTVYKYQQNFDKSLEVLQEALSLCKQIDSKYELALTKNYLAGIYLRFGQRDKMATEYHECLALLDELGETIKKASVLANVGMAYLAVKDNEKAEKYLLESLSYYEQLEDKSENWIILRNVASFYVQNNQLEKSKEYTKQSYEMALAHNHPVGISFGFREMASYSAKEGNYKEAIELAKKSLKIIEDNKLDSIKESQLAVIGKYMIDDNRVDEGIAFLKEKEPIFKQDRMKAYYHECIAEAYEKKGEFKEALTHLKQQDELQEKMVGLSTKKHLEVTEAKYQNALKEKQKEVYRLQKVELEQKAIRAQLNPHFFFNALNSVHEFILQNDTVNAVDYLERFSRLMTNTLQNSEQLTLTIKDEISFLTDYLTLEQIRFNHSFNFLFELADDLDVSSTKIPTMMLQPYVENSIKHGVSGLKNGLIKIQFNLDKNGGVVCSVIDNGKGLTANSNQKAGHKSMGTQLIQSKVKAFEEQYGLAITLRSNTIYENDSVTGTEVIINIPSLTNL